MLGSTAEGIYWMFRQLERSENTARLLEVGLRMALMRSTGTENEWQSVLTTAGLDEDYRSFGGPLEATAVADFMLRSPDNPSSVRSLVESARSNGRRVRTALTREVWEATNESARAIRELLADPVPAAELPQVLAFIRQESAFVRGAHHGTMMRNDVFNFARIGTLLERADNTARILDVKYYVLLPSVMHVGSLIDNLQWESILRAVSAQRAYRWAEDGDVSASSLARFLILDRRMPRSLAFCSLKIRDNLEWLAQSYGDRQPSLDHAEQTIEHCIDRTIGEIFDHGLHEYLRDFIARNNALGQQLEADYRFAT